MFFDYLILVLVVGGVLLSLIYCWLTGISPVSSTFRSSSSIISTVLPEQKGDICELGAGWGRLAFPLARRCPESRVLAYELSPVPWIFLKLRVFLFGPRNLKIIRRNFLKEDLSKASLVVCYLYPGAMLKLSTKLLQELKPGAQVISNTFEIPTWTPVAIKNLEDVMCPQVFYYRVDTAITSIHQFIDILSVLVV
jgi:16S rRNA A1518/A1519 N6-dimethyltransferase RsmA/KsgA/DIM1 with predicted DNA glycosylase/AP lyase activity